MSSLSLSGHASPSSHLPSGKDPLLAGKVRCMEWHSFDLHHDFVSGDHAPSDFNESFHIVVSDGEILGHVSGGIWRPLDQDEWRWLDVKRVSQHYLGLVGTVPVFANEIDPESDEPQGYEFDNLWAFLGRVDEPVFNLIGKAKQIVDWDNDHRFCGQCGEQTERSSGDRSRRCPACRRMFYPRLSPSIICCIRRGRDILLAKNAQSRGDFYSTIAGFIEPGESIEEAVHREVKEEVGLNVMNLQYISSQPWPFPNSLMLGFHAEYESGDILLQEEEIADARWFDIDALPNRPMGVSIAGRLIDSTIARIREDSSTG